MDTPTTRARLARYVAIALVVGQVYLIAARGARAGACAEGQITLLGQLSIDNAAGLDDVWGWVDPQNGKEYALVADLSASLTIVDVSDPTNPVVASTLDVGPAFDIKTYKQYAYVVDGTRKIPGSVVDLSDPTNPVVVGNFPSAHNIWIDVRGFMYKSKEGITIMELRVTPTAPVEIWTNSQSCGHDCVVNGTRLFDFHCGYTDIYDVGNPYYPTFLGRITDSAIQYHHSGWTSQDGNYLFITDEQAYDPTPDFTVWDISNPATPVKVGGYSDPDATIHNAYRRGSLLFTAYYVEGFQVFDITDPANPCLIDQYDTSPVSQEGDFQGLFGLYPFAPSDNIYGSDYGNGLYIFKFTSTVSAAPDLAPAAFHLRQNHPNPFNPSTAISYELETAAHVQLAIYDVHGVLIRTLVDGPRPPGAETVSWNGTDDGGNAVATGVYFYRLEAVGQAETRRMVLLK